MSRRLIVLLTAIALVAVFATACGGGAGGGGSTGGGGNAVSVTISATEFKFDPATINATAGQSIKVTMKNTGSVQHSFILKEANVKLIVDPGKSGDQTFNAPAKAGTYQFECDIPGHKEAGMVGQLIVK